jgi:hypothetical protein
MTVIDMVSHHGKSGNNSYILSHVLEAPAHHEVLNRSLSTPAAQAQLIRENKLWAADEIGTASLSTLL